MLRVLQPAGGDDDDNSVGVAYLASGATVKDFIGNDRSRFLYA